MKMIQRLACVFAFASMGGGITAATVAMASLASGGGELNMSGQMKGNYLRDAFNNIQRIVKLQDAQITKARKINTASFNKMSKALISLGKRVARIQAKTPPQGERK